MNHNCMNHARRVFITGHGSVSALDNSLPPDGDFYSGLLDAQPSPQAGTDAIRTIHDLHADRYIAPNQLRRLDRLYQMALIAAQKGLTSAHLTIESHNAERSGIVFNNCFGPLQTTETYVSKFIREGVKKAPAGLFPYTVVSVLTGLVTMHTKALGTNSTVSGASSVCYGLDAIRQGTDEIMMVGGVDEVTLSLSSWFRHTGYFESTNDETQPRDSFVLGEGAATVILEELTSVQQRGSRPLAEVMNYGCAHPLRSPHAYQIPAGCIEAAMRQALEYSGISPKRIGFVVSGGNGFYPLDQAEDTAVRNVFAGVDLPPSLHVKQSIGETLGASGAFSMIAAAEALHRGTLPASLTRQGDAAYPSTNPSVANAEYALVNSFEFGGNINSIVVKRYESIH